MPRSRILSREVRRNAASRRGIQVRFCVIAALFWAAASPFTAGTSGALSRDVPRAIDGPTIGVRLLDVPAHDANDPRARLYIVDHVTPGTVLHRRIEITDSGTSARVAVYPDAATITRGSFLGANGHTINDLASWTSIAPHSLDLQAGSSADVTVDIAVPHDASTGERYGVVWAELDRLTPRRAAA